MDLHLPDMPGEDVLRRLRASPENRDLPLVVLSADVVQKAFVVAHLIPAHEFLAVNLSPAAVLGLVEHSMTGWFPPDRLVIELTEHVPIEDHRPLLAALHGLREAGGRLAVDDLGSGYWRSRNLLTLEPDIIKLDTSLVQGNATSRTQRALVTCLQAFAADIGATGGAGGLAPGLGAAAQPREARGPRVSTATTTAAVAPTRIS